MSVEQDMLKRAVRVRQSLRQLAKLSHHEFPRDSLETLLKLSEAAISDGTTRQQRVGFRN